MMDQDRAGTRYYYRFTRGQRLLHGILFSTFLGLAMTGLPLRFSQSAWAEGFARAVGGFGAILFFHKSCAVALTAAFLFHVGQALRRVFIRKRSGVLWGPGSLVPQPRDLRDMFENFRWFLGLGPKPKFARFTYWEKFDYWAVFWGMAVIGISGYAMWFAPLAAKLVPGSWLNVALLLHGDEALLAVWFIFSIHFFNSHLRPDSFPMDMVIFTGRLTEDELKEEHPAEYERLKKEGTLPALSAEAPEKWFVVLGRTVGFAAVGAGFTLLVLTLISFVRQ